ncbi:MAG: lipoate--protein ligase [Lachnospiraceae bacterium]|nr:lipoate--protein ligase [Lachnospiraceae bacterium]
MILYLTGSRDPYYNLACEEYLLRYSDEDVFMLWQNEPTVVLGKNQNIYAEVNLDYTEAKGIHVVRRITGGGAVYHDEGNVNYTFITSRERASVLDFAHFTAPIVAALEHWGVKAELSGRNDLLADGLKFSGNAQHATDKRILHHGTLLFDSDLAVLSKALKPDTEKLRNKGIASVRSRVTNLKTLLPEMTVEEFIEGIASFMNAEAVVLTANEEIDSLTERNRSEDYIYGRREVYDHKAKARFVGGTVTVLVNGTKRIEKIRIEGDFFGEKDIREVEQALENCFLQLENLKDRLDKVSVKDYISGVTATELSDLIIAAR